MPPPLPVQRRDFVSTSRPYQIGKILGSADGYARVELFHSTSRPLQVVKLPEGQLRRGLIPDHTRVYIFDKATASWTLGRVLRRGPVTPQGVMYAVSLPANPAGKVIAEQDLYVRCAGSEPDPVDILHRADGLESQFHHDRRLAAQRALVRLRAGGQGLTGALSSAIDLVPHQLDIARRVLHDPVQRYLLADEVGLGKTIEAGVIVRQFLLDTESGSVLILAPRELRRQWEQELREKFGADDFPGRVDVRPLDELDQAVTQDWDMLVLDEAHHLVTRDGFAGDRYDRLARLAHRTERLLLLSATPVLGNESAMLALLHLLDPIAYPRGDLSAFTAKVQLRQEYGSVLLRMRASAPEILRRRIASELRHYFPQDPVIAELLPAFESSDDLDVRERTTGALRQYIADTYRLSHRILRTRRRDLIGGELRARAGVITVDVDTDPCIAPLCTLLEDWRDRAVLSLDASEHREQLLTRRYIALFEALGSGIRSFENELKTQTLAVVQDRVPTFPDDPRLLTDMARAVRQSSPAGTGTRSSRVLSIRASLRPGIKVAAFTSFTEAAFRVQDELERINGWPEAENLLLVQDLDHAHVVQALDTFRTTTQAATLICDRTGEEGLNLHFADTLVHLDLPLSPSRLEQRLGRLDRYGRVQTSISHRVVLPSVDADSPWLAWHQLLEHGLGLYSQSLSELQFLLTTLQPDLERELFLRGAQGLLDMRETIRARVSEERDRLDEQHALDRMEANQGETTVVVDELKRADEDEESFAGPLARWWSQALQLDRAPEPARPNVFSLRWSPSTMVPDVPWRQQFGPGLSRPLTLRRATAVQHPDVRLARPGFPLIDRQQEYLRWDDRGTAFATWRHVSAWTLPTTAPWHGFRLCYLAEADMDAMLNLLRAQPSAVVKGELAGGDVQRYAPSLRRRADAMLPPTIITMHVGADDLLVVEDEALQKLLELPSLPPPGNRQYRDYNIGTQHALRRTVISDDEFTDLCRDVPAIAERMLRESDTFQQLVMAATRKAEFRKHDQQVRLTRRLAALRAETGVDDPSLRLELVVTEAVLAGVVRPRVRLDSVGYLYLSHTAPPQAVRDA